MIFFREPMIGFSVIPTIPILWVGTVIAFEGFGGMLKGDPIQIMQFLVWSFGFCGSVGLVMASLEKTYHSRQRQQVAVSLVVCGFLAVVLSIYYAYYELGHRYHPDYGLIEDDRSSTDKVSFMLVIVWLLLLWPFMSGMVAIGKILNNQKPAT